MALELGNRRRRALIRPVRLLTIALVVWSGAIVLLHALGTLSMLHAIALVALPSLAVLSALRPGRAILLIVALPPAVLSAIPPRILTLLVAVPLLTQAFARGKLDLSFRSGAFTWAGILVLALMFRADVPPDADAFADASVKFFLYYGVLMFLAYDSIRFGHLNVSALSTAFMLGVVGGAIFELFGPAVLSESASVTRFLIYGRNFAYVAAMGVTICLARALLRTGEGTLRDHPLWNAGLGTLLLAFSAISLVRASWLAVLAALLFIPLWAGKWRHWLLVPLLVLMILSVPGARDRVLPEGLARSVSLEEYTTGRWALWSLIVKEAAPGLPWGHGFGHWASMSPEELFGTRTFVSDVSERSIVYPHNDFLFLLVELGLPGALLLSLFWFHLFAALRSALRSPPDVRRDAVLMSGIIFAFLVVQLVDNGFAIRALAERFFVAAGAIFGLAARARLTQLPGQIPAGSRTRHPGPPALPRERVSGGTRSV